MKRSSDSGHINTCINCRFNTDEIPLTSVFYEAIFAVITSILNTLKQHAATTQYEKGIAALVSQIDNVVLPMVLLVFLAVFVSRAGVALGVLCQYSVIIVYISRSLVKLASPVVDYGFLVGNSRPVLSTRNLCSRPRISATIEP